jgi:hypothetical protein
MIFLSSRLQSVSNIHLPRSIQTTLNNIRNFITRSTDNINTVRFRNARSTTASNVPTMVNRNEFVFCLRDFI